MLDVMKVVHEGSPITTAAMTHGVPMTTLQCDL